MPGVLIVEAMDEWKITRLAITVVQSREVALVKACGLRAVEAGLKVTTNTQFLIGSITKPFTSSGLALLVDGRGLESVKPMGTGSTVRNLRFTLILVSTVSASDPPRAPEPPAA